MNADTIYHGSFHLYSYGTVLDASPVEADLTQLQMVLSAVLTNAYEAIDGKGRNRVSVRDEEVDGSITGSGRDLKPGSYVCITIEDI
jgi:signal transduction histidine kinase